MFLVGIFLAVSGVAQEHIEKNYTLFFRVSQSDIDRSYKNNGQTIQTMVKDVKSTLEADGMLPDSIIIYASTSPEGPAALNERLAINRAESARALLMNVFTEYSADDIRVESRANDWSGMLLAIRRSEDIAHKNTLIKILTDPSIVNKEAAIRAIPEAYAEIRDEMFDNLRTASITIKVVMTGDNLDEFVANPELFITSASPMLFEADGGEGRITFRKSIEDEAVPEVRCDAAWLTGLSADRSGASFTVAPNPATEPRSTFVTVSCYGKEHKVEVRQEAARPIAVAEPAPAPEPEAPKEKKPFYMGVKNNMLYDIAAVPNIGLEFYLGKNWSMVGNWMYAWWKHDPKAFYWRVYGGDFAIRKWFGKAAKRKPLTGHHIGLYGQIVTYDFELGGRGYLGDRWSYGGGLEYGYSVPAGRRLNIDFNVGVGYLGGEFKEYLPIDGHYVWQVTKNRHLFGPTKAEISLVWLLGRGNVNERKGGKR